MMECPFCGKKRIATRAIRSAVRHGGVESTCPHCGRTYVIQKEDLEKGPPKRAEPVRAAPEVVRIARRPKLTEELKNYRLEYGLCIYCGEPSRDSNPVCDKCREKEDKKQ